jgi:hypothetical protein
MGGGVAGVGAGGAAATKWGKVPAGGWTREQQKKWNEEETERKARDVRMHKRVERELEEIKRSPRVVSKKKDTLRKNKINTAWKIHQQKYTV